MDAKTALRAFHTQKAGAKKRGIGWELTFKQWCDWWGADIERRGTGHDKLQMQRFHDKGPYALGNIRKGYPRDNSKTSGNCLRTAFANDAAANLQKALDSAEVSAKDNVQFDDDDWEISKLTFGRGQRRASFLG